MAILPIVYVDPITGVAAPALSRPLTGTGTEKPLVCDSASAACANEFICEPCNATFRTLVTQHLIGMRHITLTTEITSSIAQVYRHTLEMAIEVNGGTSDQVLYFRWQWLSTPSVVRKPDPALAQHNLLTTWAAFIANKPAAPTIVFDDDALPDNFATTANLGFNPASVRINLTPNNSSRLSALDITNAQAPTLSYMEWERAATGQPSLYPAGGHLLTHSGGDPTLTNQGLHALVRSSGGGPASNITFPAIATSQMAGTRTAFTVEPGVITASVSAMGPFAGVYFLQGASQSALSSSSGTSITLNMRMLYGTWCQTPYNSQPWVQALPPSISIEHTLSAADVEDTGPGGHEPGFHISQEHLITTGRTFDCRARWWAFDPVNNAAGMMWEYIHDSLDGLVFASMQITGSPGAYLGLLRTSISIAGTGAGFSIIYTQTGSGGVLLGRAGLGASRSQSGIVLLARHVMLVSGKPCFIGWDELDLYGIYLMNPGTIHLPTESGPNFSRQNFGVGTYAPAPPPPITPEFYARAICGNPVQSARWL